MQNKNTTIGILQNDELRKRALDPSKTSSEAVRQYFESVNNLVSKIKLKQEKPQNKQNPNIEIIKSFPANTNPHKIFKSNVSSTFVNYLINKHKPVFLNSQKQQLLAGATLEFKNQFNLNFGNTSENNQSNLSENSEVVSLYFQLIANYSPKENVVDSQVENCHLNDIIAQVTNNFENLSLENWSCFRIDYLLRLASQNPADLDPEIYRSFVYTVVQSKIKAVTKLNQERVKWTDFLLTTIWMLQKQIPY